MIALRVDEDLGLALQPAERLRVDDAVAVALERRADARLLLRTLAALRLERADGERGQARPRARGFAARTPRVSEPATFHSGSVDRAQVGNGGRREQPGEGQPGRREAACGERHAADRRAHERTELQRGRSQAGHAEPQRRRKIEPTRTPCERAAAGRGTQAPRRARGSPTHSFAQRRARPSPTRTGQCERDEEQAAVRVHPAAKEEVARHVHGGGGAQGKPGRGHGETVSLDEQRADEHEHAQPGRSTQAAPRATSARPPVARGRCAGPPRTSAGGVRSRRERAASPARDSTSGTTIHDRRHEASPAAPPSGMPTTQASGGPRSATASTRERSSGRLHSATAATAAEYVSPTPMPIGTCASARIAKSGATALRADPSVEQAEP